MDDYIDRVKERIEKIPSSKMLYQNAIQSTR